MSSMYEIAYAAASNRLCLFTGTGFSKSVTDDEAPGWKGLLEDLCDLLPPNNNPKLSLFPPRDKSPLSLEEAAQIISLKLTQHKLDINLEIAKLISPLVIDGDVEEIQKFFKDNSFRVITTNYDKLAELLAGKKRVQSITPGLPIPRSSADVKVYHVHGSIDSPQNMVVTSDDYFKFMNGDSYFSRKLSTILHENTVVILGYSLADTNLKRIISDYKSFSKNHVIGSNLFFISRSPINQNIKDFYFHCFGIRVIDNVATEHFFGKLNRSIPTVRNIIERSHRSIDRVIYKKYSFKDSFVKLEDSFFRFISSLSAKGLSLDNKRVVEVIGEILERKKQMTLESGAWDQYEHLASWLIYLGSFFEIRDTSIKSIYLRAVKLSMETMSKDKYYGYSWKSYELWQAGWSSINASNRALIKTYVENQSLDADAQSIVSSAT
ncbi:SIR2 family protein [Pseudomonas putida]|uniref:SIR2 family protein n=1 Tax=Pseudomonas putida TaxID=303 RepID=UPI0039059495